MCSRNGSAGVVSFTAASGGEPETYKLVDQHGTETTFFGFDTNAGAAKGQVWKIVDAEGNTAFVGDATTASTAITNGYTAQGRISKAYDSADRRFTYTYDGTTYRLTEVKAETKTGGTWSSPTGLAEVAKVNYEYYGDETYGDSGALKLVEVTTPLTDSGVSSVTASLLIGGDSNLIRPFQSTHHGYAVYKSTLTTDQVTTTMVPTMCSGKVVPEKIVITFPTVTTATNGSNTAATKEQYFAKDGSLLFEKAEDGAITYRVYTNGQLTKLIEDANTSHADFTGITIPTGFASSGAPLHRKTTFSYDAQGRSDTMTLPGLIAKTYYTKLADERHVTLHYAGYVASPLKFYGPVRYAVANHAGNAEVTATVALTSNESTTALTGHVDETDADPITAMDLGTLVRLTRNLYNETGGTLEEMRLYHDIPASGAGSDGTNYDATLYGYDDLGRRRREKAPHGTIQRTVYDIHGRTTARWVGTNDSGFTGGEPSGTDNMVKVEELEYDGGADDGNGHLTERTLFVEDSATNSRVTTYSHDALGNLLLETRPTAPHAFHKVDGHGRTIATGLFSATGSIVVGTDDPTTETANRLALSQTFYDAKGLVWKTTRHKIDAADGSDDDNLESLAWYDATGRAIKADGSQLTKTFYDRLGRLTHEFLLAVAKDSTGANEATYADADDLAFDIVLEEHQQIYESGYSAVVAMVVDIARNHDDFGGSETIGALDSNGDGDPLLVTATNMRGRVDITAYWHDQFGRLTDTVRYGTNGGANLDRDGLVVPARSDTALLTENTWGNDGALQDVVDPKGLALRVLYDDAGREVATVKNYVNGTPTSVTGEDDVYTRLVYTDGLSTKLWVDFDGDGVQDSNDQVTIYTYGTVKGTAAGDSKIATGHLLKTVAYPDSGASTDVISYAYNAQEEEIWKKDQAGNILENELDGAGRQTSHKVSTLASGFDGGVRRIQTAYTTLSLVEAVTCYDAATGGSAVNEVKYAYDGWGNVTSFKQDRDGTVGASGFYEVAQTWEKATNGRNTVRKASTTLPSGAALTYRYLGAGGLYDGFSSRLSEILYGSTAVVQYRYNGVTQVVGTDYPQPDVMSNLYGTTSGSYPDLDNFNRVVSSRWTSDLATDVDFFDVDIAYDRNSNIERVEDNVHSGFDVTYTIDNLDRLVNAQRGTWSGTGITSEKEEQSWTLMDQVGNWELVKLDVNGDGDYVDGSEYTDDRTHNAVNELTGRDTDDNGTDNYTLVYDAVGNLTDDGESYEYVYDPFGRLVKVNSQSGTLVAEYKYDGLGHMTGVHYDVDVDGTVEASASEDPWYYFAHDESWRLVATYRDQDTSPKEEFVNHQAGIDGTGGSSYLNGVILRDRDGDNAATWKAASDGVLETRYFYCQSWRGDVVVVLRSNRVVIEMARYTAYGTPIGLPGGDTNSDGACDATDVSQIQTWINSATYDVRGDIGLDGDVDAADKNAVANVYSGITLGWEALSWKGNTRGFGGYLLQIEGSWNARHRWLSSSLGRWGTRDPWEYVDAPNMYQYVQNSPKKYVDPFGTQTHGLRTLLQGGGSSKPPEEPGIMDKGRIAGKKAGAKYGSAEAENFMRHCVASCELCSAVPGSIIDPLAVVGGGVANEIKEDVKTIFGGARETDDWNDMKANISGLECCYAPMSMFGCETCCEAQYWTTCGFPVCGIGIVGDLFETSTR